MKNLKLEKSANQEGNFLTRVDINTWIYETSGIKMLFDPWYYDPAAIGPIFSLNHLDELPLSLNSLKSDLILISHHDVDHCDLKALSELANPQCTVIGTRVVAKKLKKMPFKEIIVLDFWEKAQTNDGKVTITAVPGAHPNFLKENGYIIESGGKCLYFSGDTQLIPEIADIGKQFNIDIALLPVQGVVFPILGQMVMGPEESVETLKLLRPKLMMPTSYGNIRFGGIMKNMIKLKGSLEQFLDLASKEVPQVEIKLPKPGEKIALN